MQHNQTFTKTKNKDMHMLAQKRTQKRRQEAQREVVMTDNLVDVMQSGVMTTGRTIH